MTKSNASHKIRRVAYDHLGAYHVITKDFFSLFNHQGNFVDLYQSRNEDQIVETLANNLFEVFCSMSLAPMVRVDTRDTNPINQRIIERMSQLFKEHEDKSVFSKKQRPLLMLFNRKQDI